MKNKTNKGIGYLGSNSFFHKKNDHLKAQQISQLLNKNNIKFSSICEIGCGSGELLKNLSTEMSGNITFSGYEISEEAFIKCSKKEIQNLKFYYENILIKKNIKYDVAMAIDVIEHIENCYDFLRKIKQIGIYKILHIPLELSVQAILRGKPISQFRELVGHIHYFTKETALTILRDTGFEVIDYSYTCSFLEFSNRSLLNNMLKIPRRLLFFINKDIAARLLGGFSLLILAK